jgi:surfeit locus 1 family protein
MNRRVPLVATFVVALAVATMIGLGFWQIRRAHEKETLLAQLRAAQLLPPIAYPRDPAADKHRFVFRRARATCRQPGERRTVPGRSMAGEIGYVHVVRCATAPSVQPLSVATGWSKNPNAALRWSGGEVQGVVAEDSVTGMRIIAEQPAAGLQAVEPPSLESIPNNHRGYVVTWFAFAGLALLIYVLALRSRWRDGNDAAKDKSA